MNAEREKQEREEMKRQELLKYMDEDAKLMHKMLSQQSMEKISRRKDFIRRLQLERREANLNGVVLKAQEVAALQGNQFAQEEKIASELDLIRRQEIVDQKLRLHLRENSHELKELEAQLREAYVKKGIAAQLAEKEANRLEEQIRDKVAREVMDKAIGNQIEEEMTKKINEAKQKEIFRHSLQDQIIEKERIRQQEFLSFLKEKKMFDDIIQKIKDEKDQEVEEKRFMQLKLKEEMEQFYIAREAWKAKERLTIQEEDEKIRQINEEKARAAKQNEAQKKVHNEAVMRLYQKTAHDLEQKRKQMEEKEEMISILIQNQKDEEERRKKKEELEKEIARRKECKLAYVQVLADKNRRKQEEKEAEARLARQRAKILEEDERKEKEKEEQRRQMMIDNRKYNEEAIRQNIQKRAEGLKLTQLVNDLEEKEEERRIKLVKEERIRMLREHAPNLLGYFPKGCLKKEDLEVLGLTGNSPLPESCPLGDNPRQ